MFSNTYIAQADVLNESRVDVCSRNDLLQNLNDDAVKRCIFETALEGFCERCSDGECDDDIVGVLRRADQIN